MGKITTVLYLVVIVALAPVLVFAMVLASKVVHARTPDELRRDWWPEFEREFREYARRTALRRRRQQS